MNLGNSAFSRAWEKQGWLTLGYADAKLVNRKNGITSYACKKRWSGRFQQTRYRRLATQVAQENCNDQRLLSSSFTLDLAICRQNERGKRVHWNQHLLEDRRCRMCSIFVVVAWQEIVLVHVQIDNKRVIIDVFHNTSRDGLVVDFSCRFSADASFPCVSHPLEMLQRAVLRQSHERSWTTLADQIEMESFVVRAHIGHCCTLLAVMHFLCIRDELDLDFLMLPWQYMIEIALSAPMLPIPPLYKICLCRPRILTERPRFAQGVPTSNYRSCIPCNLLGMLIPAARGPDLSWESRRAWDKSLPHERPN